MRAEERDVAADVLRAASLLLVLLGHWLAPVLLRAPEGLVLGHILEHAPWTRWGTWVFQVMPIFFVVGGALNGRSWQRAQDQRIGASAWVARRARRLLAPLLPLVAFWLILALALRLVGVPRALIDAAQHAAFLPVWFLGVYVGVVAATPLAWKLHERAGPRAIVALAASVALVDVLARGGVPLIARANTALVWGALHQAGLALGRPRSARPALGAALVALGLVSCAALVAFARYPVSMVAAGAGVPSNASPPTLALLALGLAQFGAILLARERIAAWGASPLARAIVAWVGGAALTLFLWHVTALLLVALFATSVAPWLLTAALDASWWARRPVWVLACALTLAPLVVVFRRFETPPPAPPWAGARVAAGVAASLVGIALLMRAGPMGAWTGPAAIVFLLASAAMLRILPRRKRAA